MRNHLIAIACTLSSLHAGAGELRAMLKTKSIAELESQTRDKNLRTLTHETCAAELATRLLPRACFREVTLSPTVRDQTRTQRLSQICVDNAKSSRSRLDLSGSLTDLPTRCREAALQRIQDLEYVDSSLSPATSVMRTLGPELEETSLD